VCGGGISDFRIKENIQEDVYGLDEVANLRPVSFYFTKNPDEKKYGFLAQEVQQTMPCAIYCNEIHRVCEGEEVLCGDSSGGEVLLQIDEEAINVSYIKAIKELKTCFDYIKFEIEKLEWQI
jgi:hypothetical protein